MSKTGDIKIKAGNPDYSDCRGAPRYDLQGKVADKVVISKSVSEE